MLLCLNLLHNLGRALHLLSLEGHERLLSIVHLLQLRPSHIVITDQGSIL